MVKDGSGWGAMAGVSAAFLAKCGFTGAPALTVEAPEVIGIWSDLGQRWYTSEQYIKLYPICRWAQPAVEAVLELVRDHEISASDIHAIRVETFHEAARLSAIPKNTEQAQYSLPFSVAAAVYRGTIGVSEVGPTGYTDRAIVSLARKVTTKERDSFNEAFPSRRFAIVELFLKDGRSLRSEVTEAKGDPEKPLPAEVIADKFDRLAGPIIGKAEAASLRATLETLPKSASTTNIIAAMGRPTG